MKKYRYEKGIVDEVLRMVLFRPPSHKATVELIRSPKATTAALALE